MTKSLLLKIYMHETVITLNSQSSGNIQWVSDKGVGNRQQCQDQRGLTCLNRQGGFPSGFGVIAKLSDHLAKWPSSQLNLRIFFPVVINIFKGIF